MGRPRTNIDEDLLLELLSSGMTDAEIGDALNVCTLTVHRRIEEIKKNERPLMAYDKVRHLDLISVQQRLIQGVTDEKIADAPLGQIAQAYGVFDKAKQLATGGPTEIQGLMGYLMVMEEEERKSTEEPIDVTPEPKDIEQLSLFGD